MVKKLKTSALIKILFHKANKTQNCSKRALQNQTGNKVPTKWLKVKITVKHSNLSKTLLLEATLNPIIYKTCLAEFKGNCQDELQLVSTFVIYFGKILCLR